jgi:outer membrane lipoprotein SlyB
MVNMKKTIVAAAALMLYANGANAGQTFVEVPVMNSVPIQQTSEIRTPVENCAYRLVPVDEKGNDSLLLPIIAGIVGGFAGSNIGAGNGQLAATALGAIIGVGARACLSKIFSSKSTAL